MKKTTKLKKYVELFKRRINDFLAPGVAVKTIIHPVRGNPFMVINRLLDQDGEFQMYSLNVIKNNPS